MDENKDRKKFSFNLSLKDIVIVKGSFSSQRSEAKAKIKYLDKETFMLHIKTNVKNQLEVSTMMILSREVFDVPPWEQRTIYVREEVYFELIAIEKANFTFPDESILIKDVLDRENIILENWVEKKKVLGNWVEKKCIEKKI